VERLDCASETCERQAAPKTNFFKKIVVQEGCMEKPFGILVVVLAMFVTLGALAAGLTPPAGSDAARERARVSAERAVEKTPAAIPATQAAATRSSSETANPEVERAQAVNSGN
jgi:hypothetical protein